MAFIDELRAALMHWTAGGPAILPPLPPEPGMPSGGPSPAGAGIIPQAADGTALLDSGLHLYQPRDIGDLKWSARYRRLLQLAAGTGLQDYPGIIVPALLLNRWGPEDPYPDEQLFFNVLTVPTGGANFARATLVNPLGSGVLAIVTQLTGSAGAAAITYNIGTESYTAATQPSITLRATPRDARSPGYAGTAGPGKCFIHTDANNASQFQNGPMLVRVCPINSTIVIGSVDDPVVILAPGTGVVLVPSAGAVSVIGDVQWRERPVPLVT